VDSRFRENDCGLQRPCLANDTSTSGGDTVPKNCVGTFQNEAARFILTASGPVTTHLHPQAAWRDFIASQGREVDLKTATLLGTFLFISVFAASLQVAGPGSRADLPQYANGDELARPEGYREWIFLSSGLRMSYNASSGEGATFTNVFVTPSAYHQFLATGSWPDKTVFVEEKRTSSSKGSINKAAHFQTDLMGISVQVKDVARFAEKWAFFSFGFSQKTAKANPKATCWQCHDEHGAVDATYVQLYSTLKPAAKKFGTYPLDLEGPYASQY